MKNFGFFEIIEQLDIDQIIRPHTFKRRCIFKSSDLKPEINF